MNALSWFALLAMCAGCAYPVETPEGELPTALLQPFVSDGCSEFPNGTPNQQSLWLQCCIEHDRAYWLGGDLEQRRAADAALQSCVADVGEPEVALIMLAGVRVGGSPYWPTRFRWGYGWPYWEGWKPRGYRPLSAAEWALAKQFEEMAQALNPSSPPASATSTPFNAPQTD